MNLNELKVFECGDSMHMAARNIDEARKLYVSDFGGEDDDDITETDPDATLSFSDGACGESGVLFESISYRDLIAYLASRGNSFPGPVCFSRDYC